MLSCFHRIPERDGRTDRQTDRIAVSITCAIKTDRWRQTMAHTNDPSTPMTFGHSRS